MDGLRLNVSGEDVHVHQDTTYSAAFVKDIAAILAGQVRVSECSRASVTVPPFCSLLEMMRGQEQIRGLIAILAGVLSALHCTQ